MAYNEGTSSDIDLAQAFMSYVRFRDMINDQLLPVLNDANSAAVAVLALEGLTRIEDQDVQSKQFDWGELVEEIRPFLREWRCNSPLELAYKDKTEKFLKGLGIFGRFEVPLFIDNYGKKRLMSEFGNQVEDIPIDLNTPIIHVTHTNEKEQIARSGNFEPSSNKNAMAGVWFGIKELHKHDGAINELRSVYGNWAFETTLKDLGISGLRQGEIVSYKKEVNFILYASNTTKNTRVERATDAAIKSLLGVNKAYAAVSIFVPWDFMSEERKASLGLLTPYEITHGNFCVRAKRKAMGVRRCREVNS